MLRCAIFELLGLKNALQENIFMLAMAAIYKMFGLRHFQALKNDRSVSRHNFLIFLFIFSIFLYQAQEI